MASKSLTLSLMLTAAIAGPAASQASDQSVSIPVVQPLPSGVAAASSSSLAIPTRGEGSEWDRAREQLRGQGTTPAAQTVSRWKQLIAYDNFSFAEYSAFLASNPGFPDEQRLRRNAERALEREGSDPSRIVAFFDRNPPLTNQGRAQYAVALSRLGRPEAAEQALAAWRGGPMSDANEATLYGLIAGRLTTADQDWRENALLWAGATTQAQRQIANVSPAARDLFAARLALQSGQEPAIVPAGAASDPGYLYDRSRQLMRSGQVAAAASLLTQRPHLATLPADPGKWVSNLLSIARNSDPATAAHLATSLDEAFLPGTDISQLGFTLRDDYTSLAWLGGTKALWSMSDGRTAARLFAFYGQAARTPQTRSKGFYWAGRALARAGDATQAAQWFQSASAYPDQFYGQLALERLGQPQPRFAAAAAATPTPQERAAFNASPLTSAVREVARESDWQTAVKFFREISDQANTPGQHQLVADLASQLGRRDLAVIDGQAAGADGLTSFRGNAFPLIPVPDGTDWTMVHAISRQESQFAANAISHAGARGLMQLMPGTAREQAGKVGLSYDNGALLDNPGYNIKLGDAVFARNLRYYNGSYPLAIAAYNAGPGNVNKWLAANGDPRTGAVDWIDWIERIPISETRGYVQHVLENAVVYEAMRPEKAGYRGPYPLSHFLGKSNPG